MNLDNISQKHLNDVELRIKELLVAMRKAKMQDAAILEPLKRFEHEIEEARRARFDMLNSEYKSY